MNDQRTTRRLSLQLDVDQIYGDIDTCTCITEDLSLEGMKITKVGEGEWGQPRHVWLRFRLPDGSKPIQALGVLAHEGEGNTRGFRFKYINPEARRRYNTFVHTQMTTAQA